MSILLTPIKISNVEYKNRVVMSPMCLYSSIDGFANDWHLVHLGSRAIGGVGLIMQEATAVAPIGRISPDDLGIWKEDHKEFLSKIVSFVHAQDCKIGIQLAHAGRKASTSSPWKGNHFLNLEEGGWQTIAPSAIPFNNTDDLPIELTIKDIKEVILEFKEAARRAVEVGYDVIEIHAAHGYLIHQFLSPISNHRLDEYGGTFENRIRFLVEIIEEVKKVLSKNQNLFVRISATDYIDGGWDLNQSIELSKVLKTKGVDLIDVSSGAILPDVSIQLFKNYQVPFSESIKNEAKILTGAVGIIVESSQAEEILRENKADMIFIGRELLRNPHFAIDAANQLTGQNTYPNQYLRGFRAKK